MPDPHSRRAAATRKRPPMDAAAIDALLIDDAFDDCLDRHVAARREAHADDRSLESEPEGATSGTG